MAKRRRFYRDRRNNGRRMVLTVAVVVAVAAVFWKLVLSPDKTPNKPTNPPNQASLNPAPNAGLETPTNRPDTWDKQADAAGKVKLSSNDPDIKTQSAVDKTNVPAVGAVETPKPKVTEAALKYYNQGAAAMGKRDYLAARQLLSKAVKEGLNPSQEKNARDYINQASDH